MPHEIEGVVLEGGEVAHVPGDEPRSEPVMRERLAVPLELSLAQVEHRHARAEQCEGRRLLPPTTGETQHVLPRHIAQVSLLVETGACGLRVELEPGAREAHPRLDKSLPTIPVVARYVIQHGAEARGGGARRQQDSRPTSLPSSVRPARIRRGSSRGRAVWWVQSARCRPGARAAGLEPASEE